MKDFISRISSRKFIFWATATAAMFIGKIEPWHWLVASGIFIGGKTMESLIEVFKARK